MTEQINAELAGIAAVSRPPDVAFGIGPTDVVPHDWAAWILTQMRDDELAGKKPRVFSAWIGACVMAHR